MPKEKDPPIRFRHSSRSVEEESKGNKESLEGPKSGDQNKSEIALNTSWENQQQTFTILPGRPNPPTKTKQSVRHKKESSIIGIKKTIPKFSSDFTGPTRGISTKTNDVNTPPKSKLNSDDSILDQLLLKKNNSNYHGLLRKSHDTHSDSESEQKTASEPDQGIDFHKAVFIGQGHLSQVYRAVDLWTAKYLALKMFHVVTP